MWWRTAAVRVVGRLDSGRGRAGIEYGFLPARVQRQRATILKPGLDVSEPNLACRFRSWSSSPSPSWATRPVEAEKRQASSGGAISVDEGDDGGNGATVDGAGAGTPFDDPFAGLSG